MGWFARLLSTSTYKHKGVLDGVIPPKGAIKIVGSSGSISVKGTSANTVSIKYEKQCFGTSEEEAKRILEEVEIFAVVRGDNLEVYHECKGVAQKFQRVSVNYDLEVPEKSNLCLAASSGSVNVNSISGNVDVSASSGSLRVSDVTGTLTARCNSGSIELTGISGFCTASASSGSIRSNSVKTKDFRASCSSGSINASVEPESEGNIDLRATSGSVHLRIPSDICAEIECKTTSGGISVNLPVTYSIQTRNHVSAKTISQGRPVRITAQANSGSVRVGS